MIRILIRRVPLLALIAACAFATLAHAQTTLERAKKDGFIRVGFPNQVPYAYADEKGVLTGADAVIARMVVQKMGIKEMDGVLTEFASLIPGLKAKRFDIVLAMFVNPARCAQVAFSEPIYRVGQGIIVKAGNPLKVKNYDDLIKNNDIRIAVMAGAVQTSNLKKLGVPDARIVSFPDGPSAVAAVSTGRADVFTISDLPARRLLAASGASSGLEMVPAFAPPIVDGRPAQGHSAFAFRPEDADLQREFNKALAEVIATPAFLEAMAPFGLTKDNLPDTKTADLCK
jgi:polar amino acid transport system substrate-binding protein